MWNFRWQNNNKEHVLLFNFGEIFVGNIVIKKSQFHYIQEGIIKNFTNVVFGI